LQAAEAAQFGVRISVAAEVADAYLRLRGDQARLAVTRDQIETDRHLLDLVRLRFSHELAADREVAQAEALLAQARAAIQPLEIDREAQLNRLDVLLGLQPGTMAADLGRPAAIPAVPSLPADSQASDLLRRRPDVIAAERNLAAANARIGVAVSDYYPKISLSGLLGFESLSSGQLLKNASFQPQAAAGLRWRLFDFGKVDSEVEAAKGAEAEALAQYRLSVLRATEDVENAFTALVQTEIHGQELSREVAALKRARDASQAAYDRGVIPLTDVLDADRQLLLAQDALAQTQADAARAAVGSYRALGGGWTA
jgi:NodT family efflux transporter outer membrane factor (OMF) lipoprotein